MFVLAAVPAIDSTVSVCCVDKMRHCVQSLSITRSACSEAFAASLRGIIQCSTDKYIKEPVHMQFPPWSLIQHVLALASGGGESVLYNSVIHSLQVTPLPIAPLTHRPSPRIQRRMICDRKARQTCHPEPKRPVSDAVYDLGSATAGLTSPYLLVFVSPPRPSRPKSTSLSYHSR